jgi:phospholipase/lecithinase/hemolysin
MNGVRDLLTMGAKNVLIFNQLPAQAFPYFNQLNQTTFFTAITVQANSVLQISIDAIQKNYTNTSIQIFNINTLFTKIVANESIPFSNTVDGCWDQLDLTSVEIICQDPAKYVFIDSLHLTSTVHQLIADAINPLLLYNECSKTNVTISILLISLLILSFSDIIAF